MRNLNALVLSTLLLLLAPASSLAYHEKPDVNAGAAVADALIVRPIALVVSLATTGLFFATLPLTFLTDVDEEAGEYLLYKPWWFTSGRDVGRFDHERP